MSELLNRVTESPGLQLSLNMYCSHFVEQSFPFSISSLLLRVIQPLPFVTVKRRIMGIIGVMDPINFEYLENFLWPTKKGLEDKKENKTLLNVFFWSIQF